MIGKGLGVLGMWGFCSLFGYFYYFVGSSRLDSIMPVSVANLIFSLALFYCFMITAVLVGSKE